MKTNTTIISGTLFLLIATASFPLFAARIQGLYEAEVPVAGQETEQRNQAIVQAFREVLIKVTGSRGVIRHPELASEISEAPRYVQQYRYRLKPVESQLVEAAEESALPTEESVDQPVAEEMEAVASVEPEKMLRVRFDEGAVNRLLRRHGLPVWGEARPATLLWLTVEQDRRRSMLLPDTSGDTFEAVMQVADQRGVPLLLPLMDLEDQARLHISDIWGGFADNIREASERYGPDAIITGRLVQFGPELWRASWTLYMDNDSLIWDSEGDSLEMVAEAGAQAGIDMLASRFAPVSGGSGLGRLLVRISGVSDLPAYARVSRTLREQAGVERLALVYAEPDALVFDIQIRGGREALEQGISLSSALQPVTLEAGGTLPVPAAAEGDVVLQYQLQP